MIPGFESLHEFSQERVDLLKDESSGAWRSYWQRGHVRMVFPFTCRHQERTAQGLLNSLEQVGVTVVHLVQFPRLQINHAVVVFDVEVGDEKIKCCVYDPNEPDVPAVLKYDRTLRRFAFPANTYFPGGYLNVFKIYSGLW